MKKTVVLLITFLLVVNIVGCQSKDKKSNSTTTTDQATNSTENVEDSNEEPANCDPFDKYDDIVVLTYGKSIDASEKLGEGETHENNQYTRHLLKELNIEAQTYWQVSNSDAKQKMNLAIASNDLPDAMVVNSTQLYELVKAGQLEDLTDVYNNYASDTYKYMVEKTGGLAVEAATFNGKMMGLPGLNVPEDSYHLMWVRKDWLDKLGLEPPKTIEDVKKIAKAFIEQDPDGNNKDDTIGLAGPANGGRLYGDFISPNNVTMGFDPIFQSFKSFPGFWVNDSKGKAVYGSILPETKEALAELAHMYTDGLIDPEMGVVSDATESVVAGKCGIFSGVWWMGYWPFPDVWANDPEANFQAYPIYNEDGHSYFHMGTPVNSYVVVRKGYKHPEAAMKIFNINLRDEKDFDLSLSSLNSQVLRSPAAAYDESVFGLKAMEDVFNGTKTLDSFSDFEYSIYKLLENDLKTLHLVKKEPYEDVNISAWNPEGDDNFNRLYSLLVGVKPIYDPATNKAEVYSLTYSQTKSMTSKWSNLAKLEKETFMKIIMGQVPIDEFDKFVKKWKSQGGDQITAEVQEVVDAKK